jgi:transcriptional/translational regulatory protein YebC/TACO1
VVNKTEEHDMVVISKLGQTLRTPVGKISTLGRATQGIKVMTLDPGDKVATTTCQDTANNLMEISDADKSKVQTLIEALEEDDDVVNVHTNVNI